MTGPDETGPGDVSRPAGAQEPGEPEPPPISWRTPPPPTPARVPASPSPAPSLSPLAPRSPSLLEAPTAPGTPVPVPAVPAGRDVDQLPRRRRWVAVLVGVLIVIAVIAGVGTYFFVDRTLPPLRAVYDFANDLEDGHYAAAYRRLCRVDQLRNDTTAFRSSVLALLGPHPDLTVNPFSVDRTDNRATVDIGVSSRGRDQTITVSVAERGGDWHPCSIGRG
jgi:hypothetical protein